MPGPTMQAILLSFKANVRPAKKGVDALRNALNGFEKGIELIHRKSNKVFKAIDKKAKDQNKQAEEAIENQKEFNQTLKKTQAQIPDKPAKLIDQTDISDLSILQAIENLRGPANLSDPLDDANRVAETFYKNMQDVNETLSFTRDELRAFSALASKIDGVSWGRVGVSDVGEAIEGLVRAGVRAKKSILAYAPAVALVAKATGLKVDDVAYQIFKLDKSFGISTKSSVKLFSTMKKLAQDNAVSIDDLNSSLMEMEDDLKIAFASLGAVGEEQKVKVMESFAAIQAAAGDNWVNLKDTSQKLAQAMADPMGDAARQMAFAAGMGVEEMRSALIAGDVGDVMKNIMSRASLSAQQGAAGMQRFAEMTGISAAAVATMATSQHKIIRAMNETNDIVSRQGDGFEEMASAIDNQTNAADKFKNVLSAVAGKQLPLVGMSIVDITGFLREIDFVQLLSGLLLFKQFLPVLGAVKAALAGVFAKGLIVGAGVLAIKLAPLIIVAGAVALAIWAIKNNWTLFYGIIEPALKELAIAWEDLKAAVMDVFTDMTKAMDIAGGSTKNLGAMLAEFLAYGVYNIIFAFKILLKILAPTIKFLWKVFKPVFEIFGLLFGNAGSKMSWPEYLSAIFNKLFIAVVPGMNIFNALWETIFGAGFFETIKAFFSVMITNMKNTLATIRANAYDAIWGLGNTIVVGMASLFKNLWDSIIFGAKNFLSTIASLGLSIVSILGVDKAIDGAAGLMQTLLAVVQVPLQIMKDFVNKWIIGGINSIVNWTPPLLSTTLGGLVNVLPIPALAEGGIAKSETVALVGEGPAAPEVIAPLSELQKYLAPAAPASVIVHVDVNGVNSRLDRLIEFAAMMLQSRPVGASARDGNLERIYSMGNRSPV